MRLIHYYILLLLWMVLVCRTAVQAQQKHPDVVGEGYFVKRYTLEDGLAGDGNYLLCRDRQGFLWVGGFQGLSRFDGARFTVYNTTDGLPANTIDAMRTDTAGDLYVSAANRIYRYTGIMPTPFRMCRNTATTGNMGVMLPIDSTHIYLTDLSNRSLFYLENGRRHRIPLSTLVIGLERDRAGMVYALTSQNRIYLLRDSTIITTIPEPPYVETEGKPCMHRSLERNAAGNVYYNATQLYRLQERPPFISRCNTGAAPYWYNYLIVPSKTGMLYRHEGLDWAPYLPFPADMDVNSAMVTEKDCFWLTNYNGLAYYYPKQYRTDKFNPLFHYFQTVAGCRILRNDSSLYRDAVIRHTAAALQGKRILSIYRANDGSSTWFCTYNGLYYLLKGDRTPRAFNFRMTGDWVSNVFKAALEDRQGRIWIESYNGSLCYDHGRFYHWDEHDRALSDLAIYYSIIDTSGIYYASGTKMYAWMHGAPQTLDHLRGLNKDMILSLARDREGNIWICPNEPKLLKIGHDHNGHFYTADSLDLIAGGKPYIAGSITFDQSGNLWAAGSGRLAVYLRQPDGRFTNASRRVLGGDQQIQQLTQSRTFLYTSEHRDTVYAWQDDTLATFVPQSLLRRYRPAPPNCQLTGIALYRQTPDWPALGFTTDRYGMPVAPVFNSRQNNLTFQFTGITATEPEAVTYRYRLDGYDREWQPVTATQEAGYTNLPPGAYTFRVAAADISGQWSAPASFRFTIRPPWYRTWWAYILWALIGAGLIWLLVQLRVRMVRRRERIDRLIVEQQLKALRAQINPHFLQNSFDFLAHTIEEQPMARSQQVIRQLSAYLRRVLERTDENIATLEDELIYAEEYLAVNQLLFRQSFRYRITIDEEVDTFGIMVPSMLLQPLLENAIKHGVRHTGAANALIEVEVYARDQAVYCVVSNPVVAAAKGYAPGYRPKGLAITAQRLSLLYKNAQITAAAEDGLYKVTIRIPD